MIKNKKWEKEPSKKGIKFKIKANILNIQFRHIYK